MSTDTSDSERYDPSGDAVVNVESTGEKRREHGVLVYLMIVIAAVILIFTAVNVWVDRAALNTDNWVDAADDLLADSEVREAVSEYIVDELYENVDVASQIEGLLPSDLSGLSGPLAAALQNPATDAVDRLLATQAAAKVWSDANRVAHDAIVRILEDEGDVVSTTNGNVTIDLRDLVVQLADTIGLPASVTDRLPDDAGQVSLVQSSTLADLQTAVTVIQWASVLLFLVVLALFVGAVALARDWRRVATRDSGIAITIVGLLLLAGIRVGGDQLLDSVVKVESNRPAAEAVWAIGAELLHNIAWSLTILGLVVIVAAVLAGETRAARAVRGFIAPAFTGSPAIRWGIGIVVFLILIWWAPLAVFTSFLGMIATAAILAALIEGMRGLCLHDESLAAAAGAPDDEHAREDTVTSTTT